MILKDSIMLSMFLPRDAMYSADYAVARYPSVCLSHAGILSKRLNKSSNFFTVGQPQQSSFSVPNRLAVLRRGPP